MSPFHLSNWNWNWNWSWIASPQDLIALHCLELEVNLEVWSLVLFALELELELGRLTSGTGTGLEVEMELGRLTTALTCISGF